MVLSALEGIPSIVANGECPSHQAMRSKPPELWTWLWWENSPDTRLSEHETHVKCRVLHQPRPRTQRSNSIPSRFGQASLQHHGRSSRQARRRECPRIRKACDEMHRVQEENGPWRTRVLLEPNPYPASSSAELIITSPSNSPRKNGRCHP